jgi:glycyl-tRNA synthetase beta subunit
MYLITFPLQDVNDRKRKIEKLQKEAQEKDLAAAQERAELIAKMEEAHKQGNKKLAQGFKEELAKQEKLNKEREEEYHEKMKELEKNAQDAIEEAKKKAEMGYCEALFKSAGKVSSFTEFSLLSNSGWFNYRKYPPNSRIIQSRERCEDAG